MSRGGRRRRGRRKPDGAGKEGAQGPQASADGSQRRRRRRRGGRPRLTEASAVAAMSSRQTVLQTLPDDGTVLEELIDNMRSEFGPPTTPQEYRLLVKVLGSEEASESVGESIRLDPPDVEERVEGAAEDPHPRPRRRRSRRRRKRMTLGEIDVSSSPDGEEGEGVYEEMESIGPSVEEDPPEEKPAHDDLI